MVIIPEIEKLCIRRSSVSRPPSSAAGRLAGLLLPSSAFTIWSLLSSLLHPPPSARTTHSTSAPLRVREAVDAWPPLAARRHRPSGKRRRKERRRQILFLYVLYEDIGGAYALLPFLLHALAFYHVFYRWKDVIDGRFDLKQLLVDAQYRMDYAFAVFGSLGLAVFAHLALGNLEDTGANGSIYILASWTQILAAAAILAVEVYEVALEKLR